jgi:hypothetical protein
MAISPLVYTVTPTGSNSGTSWTTLQGALAALYGTYPDLTASSGYTAEIKVDNSWSAWDTTAVTANLPKSKITNWLWIHTTAAARHLGHQTTAAYGVYVTNAASFHPSSNVQFYVIIDGLQFGHSSVSAAQYNFYVNAAQSGSVLILSDCLTQGAANNSYSEPGLTFGATAANLTVYIWNHIDCGHGTYATSNNAGLYLATAQPVYCYNSVFAGNYNGVIGSGTALTMKNCYASGSHAAYTTVNSMTTCASSDTTGSSGLTSMAKNTTQFQNVTPGSEDFRIAGTGSGLYHTGTYTQGDAAPMNFTTDIIGTAYDNPPSIGASEYVAASSPVTVALAALAGAYFPVTQTVVATQNLSVGPHLATVVTMNF